MRSLQNDSSGVIRAVRSFLRRKPVSTCESDQKLRISRPARDDKKTESATSAMASDPRMSLRNRDDSSASYGIERLRQRRARRLNAGASPKAKPVRMARPPVNISTRQSRWTSSRRGVSEGKAVFRIFSPAAARPSQEPRRRSPTARFQLELPDNAPRSCTQGSTNTHFFLADDSAREH